MARRIRVFIIDEKTGKPRAKVAIVISAEVSSSKEPGTDTFTFGILQSDHAGYLSTVIPDHIKPLHLWVSLLTDSSVRVDAGATVSSGLPQAVVILKIPTASEALPKRSYPALHEPDNHDREISPYSFARETELHVGQGSCEDFLPNGSPERTFSFTEIMLDAGSPSSDLIPSNTNKPQSLPFSHLRRGALIKYSMEWLPLGHALGEIIYSLPLAPCESVNLAVIDWRREDQATRQEATGATEELNHDQRRDRAVEETVSTALREWQSGNTVSVGGTVGVSAAGIGASVTAGASWSSTTGGRNLSGETLQSLADSVSQASSLIRNLYSTVIVQSSQTELDSVQTRAIRNHNHCHALTILYYEVLRQYKIITKIAKVQDVILLKQRMFPPASSMSYKTLLAFRHILEDKLLEPRLRSCFDAIVRREYEEVSETTSPTIQDSPVIYRLWFYVSIPTQAEAGFDPDENQISPVSVCLQRADILLPLRYSINVGLPEGGVPSEREIDPTERTFVEGAGHESERITPPPLRVSDIVRVGVSTNIEGDAGHADGDEWHLGRLRVEYSLVGSETIRQVLFDSNDASFGVPAFPLPYHFKTRSGAAWWGPTLVSQNQTAPAVPAVPAVPDPIGSQRKADVVCAKRLLDHVNANGPYYRSLILMNTHPDYYAVELDKITYQSGTLLEHADFHPIAVFGDYIVFPLNTASDSTSSNSLAQELLASKISPAQTHVSLPTRGVLAEAKLSTCNACEEIDVTRFWNWTESPCTDEAPLISGVTPGSRARDIDTRPSDLPTPVVNIVNPPAAPDPTALAAAMNVIGTPNIFRDMSGRQELSSLLQRLTDGTISMAQARREAQRVQAQQQSANDNTRSAGAGSATSARELHDNNQVIRSAVAHGDVSEAEGRRLISAQSRQAILGSESTGPGLSVSGSDLPVPENPLFMPLPEQDRWYQGWLLLYNFDVDSVNLKSEHMERLDELIRTLNLLEAYRIEAIQGRASETGPEDHNRDLSEQRGSGVRRYLIDHGLSETIIAELPNPPLGSSDPLRVMPNYREDEVNRSVLAYYRVLIPAARIPPPPPRTRPPATAGLLSQDWALRVVVSGTAHSVGGLSLADVHIKNCRTREVGAFALVGIGLGVSAGASFGGGDWTSFRTLYPAHLGDFHQQFGVYYTAEGQIIIGYGSAYLRMPYLIDGPVNLSGWSSQLDRPKFEVGGYADIVELMDLGDDRFQDDNPCS